MFGAHQEPMQRVRGGGPLPAPARKDQMQGVRGASICQHQRVRIRAEEGAAHENLGIAYDLQGDYAKAIEYYTQRLAMQRGEKRKSDTS